MGAIFTVALAHVSDVGELPGERIALAADAGEPLQAGAGRRASVTLLVGSERDGLPAEILAACERVARIPIATDSLNAAMAATVALYEMTRRPHGVTPASTIRSRRHDRSDRGAAERGRAARSPPPARAPSSRSCACATSVARPSCRSCCAASPSSQPEQRGAVGKAANQARQALEALIAARARMQLAGGELERAAAGRRVDVTLPGAPPQPIGAPARAHAPRAASSKTSSSASASPSWRAPRSRPSTTTSTRSTTAPHTPRGRAPTPSTSQATRARPPAGRAGAAHAHLADAGARDGGAPAAAVRGDPRTRLPTRLRRHAHAAVPPDRGARRRRGHHARRPQGHAAGVRPRGLRRRARRAPAPALLPLHRAQRRGRRVLLSLRRQRLPARRLALLAVQGRGLARGARRRRGRPQRLRPRPHHRAQRPRL